MPSGRHEPDVVVIGAGISGLTSAIRLLEAGHAVRVVAESLPAETTSAVAGGIVAPIFDPPGDPSRVRAEATHARLAEVGQDEGVHVLEGLFVARPAGMIPPYADQAPGFRLCARKDLPAGYGSGFHVTVPVVDMVTYLPHLVDELLSKGGDIEQARIASLEEAQRIAPLVVNCSGLGAGSLLGDTDIHPIRGAHVVVRNPGITTFFLEAPFSDEFTSYVPFGDRVVLGGTREMSDDLTPRDEEAAALQQRCAQVEPLLGDAEIIHHQVGLRLGRSQPRVEAEALDQKVVVHNYGHGGVGVMLSWGCASEVEAIIRELSTSSPGQHQRGNSCH